MTNTPFKLGLMCYRNNTGLGNQTRRLVEMLKPDRLLVIDNSGFSKVQEQNTDWYQSFKGYIVHGFPSNHECDVFLRDLTHAFFVENTLNNYMLTRAQRQGTKTYIQSNYEFCDHLIQDLSLPTKFLMPSYWKVTEMEKRFNGLVRYLPPPIDPQEFLEARKHNFNRKGTKRFLHIVGTLAANDRNGTLDLLKALPHTKAQFELVIKSQQPLPSYYHTEDSRVKYVYDNQPIDRLYYDFDALILPRRYGGLCLPMVEAMISGMPVIMTDIEPNSQTLPSNWLVKAEKQGSFFTRTEIDIYSAEPKELARRITAFVRSNLQKEKMDAFEIAYENYAMDRLEAQYKKLW